VKEGGGKGGKGTAFKREIIRERAILIQVENEKKIGLLLGLGVRDGVPRQMMNSIVLSV
jgi:hypothetical protein